MTKKQIFLLILAFILFNFLLSVGFSLLAVKNLKRNNLFLAAQHSKKAVIFPKITNALTFNLMADVKVWQISLETIIKVNQVKTAADDYSQTVFLTDAANFEKSSLVLDSINSLSQNIEKLNQANQKSLIAKKYLEPSLLENISILSADGQKLAEHFLTGKHRYIIVLQNSQEIRATGGFMGSFARLHLNHGQIEDLIIEDIYEPTGQFTGFVEAPPGVKEYLSGGQGMRLPDSNWHPDFPSSAQQILHYFALGKQQSIEGVFAINLDLLEDILKITGPLYLADSKVTINKNNLAELARENRKDFFPGSQEKTNFLAEAFNQIKFKLSDLNEEQKIQLVQLLIDSLENKNIQLYSNHSTTQDIFEKYNLAGELKKQPDKITLMLVESNVGINKANKGIEREILIKTDDQVVTIDVNFSNNNKKPTIVENTNPYYKETQHLAYINYQRVITDPDVTVKRIALNNQDITNFNEDIIINSKGEEFKQIGFLITLAEQKKGNLTVELKLGENYDAKTKIFVQKQAGLDTNAIKK